MMSALEALDAREIEVVGLALIAVLDGAFFPDWEFETLLGLTRSEMGGVVAGWPGNLRDPITEAAVFNALANLQGYPHGLDGALPGFGLTSDSIGSVLDKLRSKEP
jgi:hypothetical protein